MPPASRTGIGNKGPSGHRRALRKRAPGIINRHATTRTQKVHDQDISNAPSRLFRFAADPAISATTSNNAAKRAPRAARHRRMRGPTRSAKITDWPAGLVSCVIVWKARGIDCAAQIGRAHPGCGHPYRK